MPCANKPDHVTDEDIATVLRLRDEYSKQKVPYDAMRVFMKYLLDTYSDEAIFELNQNLERQLGIQQTG
jgi:hypothetical protein